jgi:hypothetical protein
MPGVVRPGVVIPGVVRPDVVIPGVVLACSIPGVVLAFSIPGVVTYGFLDCGVATFSTLLKRFDFIFGIKLGVGVGT